MGATSAKIRRVTSQELPRTIWYMGAKARMIPGLLDRVFANHVPPRGAVLDLFSGSGIVSAFCARRWIVVANDVQLYSRAITASLIERPPGGGRTFERAIDIDRDLLPSFEENRRALADLYAPAIEMETALLADGAPRRRSAARADLAARYRAFLSRPGGLHGGVGAGPVGRGNGSGGGASSDVDPIYRGAAGLLADPSLARYRQDPRRRPAFLITAYYASFYYGLRQAIDLDSLRAAIDDLPRSDPLAERMRLHYLSALLHAASVTTSGTSHFAQPRQVTKDSEVLSMIVRRRLDVLETFREFSAAIARHVAASDLSPRNRTFCGDYRDLIDAGDAGDSAPRWKSEAAADVVYMDPPYTGDNYSRFYHVLETLARYDYPELERDASGQPTVGRYPVIEKRFLSGFCSRRTVENEFRRVIEASAVSGVPLVISYGSPNGLLLKVYRGRHPDRDPVECLEDLCKESYRSVKTHRRRLIHSGQGDKNRDTDELLIVCTRVRR